MSDKSPLVKLRQWMAAHAATAVYVPIGDPHNDEYIPAHWQALRWLTGFTGSAGSAVVTLTDARLWTDSRYWLQAAEELKDTGFSLMKEGADGVPGLKEWCKLQGVKEITVPDDMVTASFGNDLVSDGVGVRGVSSSALFDGLWTDRPPMPEGLIDVQPLEWAGQTVADKLDLFRHAAQRDGNEGCFIIGDLSDIAWMLNLRGRDVECNPIFLAWLVYELPAGRFTLFTHTRTLSPAARRQLEENHVAVDEYDRLLPFLGGRKRLGSAEELPLFLYEAKSYAPFVSPAPFSRATKNEAEQHGFREAMERDGVALVKFRRWIEERLGTDERLTEMSIDRKLTSLRAEQPGYEQLSFCTIAGYAAHGAIVHYEATPQTDAVLERRGLLLLDSGAQYDCGTTDITRTIPMGPLTEEERRVFTLVLKGHLALQRQQFPVGTTGIQLDLAARQYMWNAGYDFGHGTGHGVGAHLCVHEGPHQIRKNLRACTQIPLTPGMTVTDEPGIYVEGKFGVRIENTLLVQPAGETPFGKFLKFEPLTLCPYDMEAADLSMLTAGERVQIDSYHAEVARRLMPRLTDEADRQWLARATSPLAG